MFSFTFVALALPLFASAQTIHDVQVGDSTGSLTFTPEAIFASQGDQVRFTFHQKNHSVMRTSFASPCSPLPEADGGFVAPFFPVPTGQNDNLPTWTITVNDTKPIWVACPQTIPAVHCFKGMVFAVNCGPDGAENSFANFKQAALALGASAASGSAAPVASPTDIPSTISIPPAPDVSTVTATISVGSSVWTTTYGSYPNSPAPTPASLQGNVIDIAVGDGGNLTFTPSFVRALPRDILRFTFKSKNHTVTQSSFANPCKKLNNATTNEVGFDSGFMPVAPGSTEFPTFNITVNDTSPTWIYCKQTNPVSHCGKGMVMAVNSDESSPRSSAAFKALAQAMNGTSNNAAPTSSSSAPSASRTNGAVRTTCWGIGLLAIIGSIMAML